MSTAPAFAPHVVPPSAEYPLSVKHELFAQQIASDPGADATAIYARVYGLNLENPVDMRSASGGAGVLLKNTRIRLRIHQLQEPVIRKLRRKLEYTIQQAFEHAAVAYDLALESGDVKSLIKAVELQSKLGKLLSEDINVNHRYGVLDDADTATLLEMRKMVEEKKAKQLRLAAPVVEATYTEVPRA
jgi:hypothetical protein